MRQQHLTEPKPTHALLLLLPERTWVLKRPAVDTETIYFLITNRRRLRGGTVVIITFYITGRRVTVFEME